MRADEITDIESFEAWLNARPEKTRREEAVALVTRAALRVFPIWVCEMSAEWAGRADVTVQVVARMVLTSSVAARLPTDNVMDAASASSYVRDRNVRARGGRYCALEAYSAASASASASANRIFSASDFSAAAYSAGIVLRFQIGDYYLAEKQWDSSRKDCHQVEQGQDVLQLPLWADTDPNPFEAAWQEGRDWMQSVPGHTFWIRWYEAILAGRPLTGDWDSHWQLLHDIALIPDADWENRAEYVAGLIEEIERNYAPAEILEDPAEDLSPTEAVQELEQRLPLNESVAQDAETSRFYLVEDRAHDDPTIESLLEQVEDNLDDCLAAHNGIRGDDRVARVVRRVLSKYREKPLRIEMDFTDAIKGFRSNLTSGEYDTTDDNSALLVSLEDTVRLVRKTHPEVAEVRDHLAQVEMSRLSSDDKAALAEAKEVLVEASKGELAEDFGEDIAELLLPALPSAQATGNAPPLPGASRTFSRAAKMLEIVISQDEIDQKTAQRKEPFWDRTGDLVRKIDNSAAYKGARIVGTAGSLAGVLWAVVQIGLRVLTVL